MVPAMSSSVEEILAKILEPDNEAIRVVSPFFELTAGYELITTIAICRALLS